MYILQSLSLIRSIFFLQAPTTVVAREAYRYEVNASFFNSFGESLLERQHGFISELISNAIDACRKVSSEAKIDIEVKDNGFLIRDKGIGMSKDDIKNFIGSIGASDTRNKNDPRLIGRFGLGLYSVFREASTLTIVTKKKDNPAFKAILRKGENHYEIMDGERDEVGTDVHVELDGIKLDNKIVSEWIKENLINDDVHIRLLKTKEEIETERKMEYERKVKAIQDAKAAAAKANKTDDEKAADENKIDDEKVSDDANKTDDEKAGANKTDDEKAADDEKTDDENKTDDDKADENKTDDEKTDEVNIEDIKIEDIEIDPYKYVVSDYWPKNNSEEELKRVFKDKFGPYDLAFQQHVTFTVRQKNPQGKEWNPKYEALIYIPTIDEFSQPREGKLDVYVHGTKIVDPNLQVPELLKYAYFILKSNEALISSTRESFCDSKNACRSIINGLQKKVIDILITKSDEVIHKYSSVIKAGYMENKRNGNEDIIKRLAGILTFKSDSGIMSLNKFRHKIDDINELHEAKEKADADKEKGDADEKTDDENKTDDANKTDDEKIEEKKTDKKEVPLNEKYDKVDAIYYTTALESSINNITNPVSDGIKVPFIFLNGYYDEEIVNSMKEYRDLKLVNIITKQFVKWEMTQEEEDKYKDILAYIKELLNEYVDNVVISKRLLTLPFSLRVSENSLSSSYKSLIGENNLINLPWRSIQDPKPILEVNVNSNEIKEIISLFDDKQKNEGIIKSSIISMFVGTSIACKVDLYNKRFGYLDLMNAGRRLLGTEEAVKIKHKTGGLGDLFGDADDLEAGLQEYERKKASGEIDEEDLEDMDDEGIEEDLDDDEEIETEAIKETAEADKPEVTESVEPESIVAEKTEETVVEKEEALPITEDVEVREEL